jgi:hypothetical protein
MKRTLTATSLAIALAGPQTSATANAQSVTIKYAYSCATWAEVRRKGFSIESMPAQGWLVGLMNGLALESGYDVWRNLQEKQVFMWMDLHCARNPLDSLVDATYKLLEERLD